MTFHTLEDARCAVGFSLRVFRRGIARLHGNRYQALGLSQPARLVPLRVLIPTLGLLIVQLLLDLVPPLAHKSSGIEQRDPFGIERFQEKYRAQVQADPAERVEELPTAGGELSVWVWVLMMLAFIYLFGFFVAVPLYTVLYLTRRSREGWLVSMAIAGGMWGMVYGVFAYVLRGSSQEGHLWGWLGR